MLLIRMAAEMLSIVWKKQVTSQIVKIRVSLTVKISVLTKIKAEMLSIVWMRQLMSQVKVKIPAKVTRKVTIVTRAIRLF